MSAITRERPAHWDRLAQVRIPPGMFIRLADTVLLFSQAGRFVLHTPIAIEFDTRASATGGASSLTLKARPSDHMLINGAVLEFTATSTVTLVGRPNFVFGNSYMLQEEVTGTLREAYYRLQQAYAGPADQREDEMREFLVAAGELPKPVQERLRALMTRPTQMDALGYLREEIGRSED